MGTIIQQRLEWLRGELMIDIGDILNSLAKRRPVFHSEADFQHAFAWEINLARPNVNIRLEYPVPTESKPYHIDVRIENKDEIVAIELKYKTVPVEFVIDGEPFRLKNHSARDQGRYDFIKDIQRLEHVSHAAEKGKKFTGYAILLTNDNKYWDGDGTDKNTADAAFKIYVGRTLNGRLNWTANASVGTTKNREKEIELKGSYKVEWKYYNVEWKDHKIEWEDFKGQEDKLKFHYLAIKV